MSEESKITPAGMGLTARQAEALQAITAFVGRHGVMPSRSQLAMSIGCNKTGAVQLITRLVERGEVSSLTPGGPLSGFGRGSVAVLLPPHIAAKLSDYCAQNGERVPAVVADAIVLHLDALAGPGDESAAVARAVQDMGGEA